MAKEKGGYFEIAPVCSRLQQYELSMTLYLNQIASGERNQQVVVVPNGHSSFGKIAANDWTVFDSKACCGGNLVGNFQGMHLQGSMTANVWCIYSDLVFKKGRFHGSTLKLLGSFGPGDDGEWAIVGGTGEFSLAQGVASFKKVHGGGNHHGNLRELKFRVFYTPMHKSLQNCMLLNFNSM